MILLIMGISLIMIIVLVICYEKDIIGDDAFDVFSFLCIILLFLSLIIAIILGIFVTKLKPIDDCIAMYEEENIKIEEQIDAVVKQYQEYESDIFANTKSDSSITLVSLYPELKADSLVQSQINVYISNNNTIRELKEEKINGQVLKWWLYFG